MGNFFKSISNMWNPPPAPQAAPQQQATTHRTMTVHQAGMAALQAQSVPSPPSDAVVRNERNLNVATAVRHQPNFQLEDNQGHRIQVSQFLNTSETELLQRLCALDPSLKHQLLKMNPQGASVEQLRQHLIQNLERSIVRMTEGGKLNFTSQGRAWQIEDMLGLALSVKQLPIAQRKQLDGMTFERAPRPAVLPGTPIGLLDRLAMETTAGRYDIQSKTISLYDRGAQDGLPALSSHLKRNLSGIRQHNKEDVRQLQKLLNPYLGALKEAPLPTDGDMGPKTRQAIRMVQIELLDRYLQDAGTVLSAEQRNDLSRLKTLAASPQFDMLSRMAPLSQRLQSLQLLPDAHLKQLLNEFARNDFGETTLQMLMQDVSDDFRSMKGRVSRVEEVMTHEMGHHFQLGIRNEEHYISEFAKISDWRNTQDGEAATGFIDGMYSNENVSDVFSVIASRGSVDKGHYRSSCACRSCDAIPNAESRGQVFVSNYAATDPMEDFAESYKTFVLDPVALYKASPEKFFFLNALPAIQGQLDGQSQNRQDGLLKRCHYPSRQAGSRTYDNEGAGRMSIEDIVSQALQDKLKRKPTNTEIKKEIADQFTQMLKPSGGRKENFDSDILVNVIGTHQEMLSWAGLPAMTLDIRTVAKSEDNKVFDSISENLRVLIDDPQNRASKNFMARLQNPSQIDQLFPKASATLRQRLKDPSYLAMTLVMGQVSAHGLELNRLHNVEHGDRQNYKQAENYFSQSSGSALFSTRTLSEGLNYARGMASDYLMNPEASRISQSERFLLGVEQNPRQMFPQLWGKLPEPFREMIQDRAFLQQLSGDGGKVRTSPETNRRALAQVLEVLAYQKGL